MPSRKRETDQPVSKRMDLLLILKVFLLQKLSSLSDEDQDFQVHERPCLENLLLLALSHDKQEGMACFLMFDSP